jgi:hypothetical protein
VVKVDPNTSLFDDGKTKLQDYVYSQLKERSRCCGEDVLYVEVSVRKDGYVEKVKVLSGKNDCYKKSIVDILMPIRWDPEKIQSERKSLYLELLPRIECKGKPDENIYQPIQYGIERPVSSNQDATVEQKESKPEMKDQLTQIDTGQSSFKVASPHQPPTTVPQDTSKPKSVKPKFAGDLPMPKYVSTGDKKPDSSHVSSFVNMSGLRIPEPEYVDGASAMAIYIKKELKKRGVCGLVHLLAEITIDKGGKVIDHRILNINRNDIVEYLPEILLSLKFKPETVPIRTHSYVEFKADISCGSISDLHTDLMKIPDYILTPEEEERKGGESASQKKGEELTLPKDE